MLVRWRGSTLSTDFGTKVNQQFLIMEDEGIVDLVHQGNSEALDYLIHKYRNFVRAKARSYFLIGADKEDIVQEGMIGLYKDIPLNSYVSLDKPIYDEDSDRTLMDVLSGAKVLDPEELIINQEEFDHIE